ncbi:transposase [Streptomyces sp. NPDC005525]|uniref:transposase n=1 Tax=Streptomyces sp. NPDC005525 TaxID=3364720 RepID=UPI00368157A6
MAGRGELTDTTWERIEPRLPQADGRGRPWRDHRQVVNGVLWRLRTGGRPGAISLERYGPWQAVCERFARWGADGTWAKLLELVQVRDGGVGRVEWTVSVDSIVNRPDQHAAGARKKGMQTGTNRKIRAAHRRARTSAGPEAG